MYPAELKRILRLCCKLVAMVALDVFCQVGHTHCYPTKTHIRLPGGTEQPENDKISTMTILSTPRNRNTTSTTEPTSIGTTKQPNRTTVVITTTTNTQTPTVVTTDSLLTTPTIQITTTQQATTTPKESLTHKTTKTHRTTFPPITTTEEFQFDNDSIVQHNDLSYEATADYHFPDLNGNEIIGQPPLISYGPPGFGWAVDLNGNRRLNNETLTTCLRIENMNLRGSRCFSDPSVCSKGLSLSIWVKKRDATVDDGYIFDSKGTDQTGISLYREGGRIHANLSTSLGSFWYLSVPEPNYPNIWYNIAIRWHAKLGLEIFINGESAGSVRVPDKNAIPFNQVNHANESEVTVGCRNNASNSYGGYVEGEYDELAIWLTYLRQTDAFMGGYACDQKSNVLRCEANITKLFDAISTLNLTDLTVYKETVKLLKNVTQSSSAIGITDDDLVAGDAQKMSASSQVTESGVFNSVAESSLSQQKKQEDLTTLSNIIKLVVNKTSEEFVGEDNGTRLPDIFELHDVLSNIFSNNTRDLWNKMQSVHSETGASNLTQLLNQWSLLKLQQSSKNFTTSLFRVYKNIASLSMRRNGESSTNNTRSYLYFPDYEKHRDELSEKWPEDNPSQDQIRIEIFANQSLHLHSNLYRTFHLFTPLRNSITGSTTKWTTLDSRIISFDMLDDDQTDSLLEDPLVIFLERRQPRLQMAQRFCVRWDEHLEMPPEEWRGGWSHKSGCRLHNATDTYTTCLCNQTGIYAVLAQVASNTSPLFDGRSVDEAWLLSIKWILYSISVLLLLLYVVVVASREQFHEQFHGIRVNTALAAIGGLLAIFATDFNKGTDDQPTVFCPVLSLFVQFFYTAVASWLVMDAHALFSAVVSGVVGGRLRSYCCIGWGIPLIVIGAFLAIFPYGQDDRCMVGSSREMKLFLICPILVLGGLALLISLLVVCNLDAVVIKREHVVKELGTGTKSCLGVSLIFVSTWVLAIYALVGHRDIFYTLFVIANSSFGIFYVMMMGICSSPFRRAIYLASDPGAKANRVDPSTEDLKSTLHSQKDHYT